MRIRRGNCHRCDYDLELYPSMPDHHRYVTWLCSQCYRVVNNIPGTPESYDEAMAKLVERRAEIDAQIRKIREATA